MLLGLCLSLSPLRPSLPSAAAPPCPRGPSQPSSAGFSTSTRFQCLLDAEGLSQDRPRTLHKARTACEAETLGSCPPATPAPARALRLGVTASAPPLSPLARVSLCQPCGARRVHCVPARAEPRGGRTTGRAARRPARALRRCRGGRGGGECGRAARGPAGLSLPPRSRATLFIRQILGVSEQTRGPSPCTASSTPRDPQTRDAAGRPAGPARRPARLRSAGLAGRNAQLPTRPRPRSCYATASGPR